MTTVTTPEETPPAIAPPTSEAEVHALVDKLRTVRSRITENEQTAAADRARILAEATRKCDETDAWLAAITRADRGHAALLEASILAYHREHPVHGRAGRVFPGGSIVQRSQPPEYQRDATALLSWAGEHGYIRTTTTDTVDWSAIKGDCHVRGNRLVTSDGEVVPGVEVVERPPTIEVQLEDDHR